LVGDDAYDGHRGALRWGWIGVGAALASAAGYALQHELSYVSKPSWIGEIEFYGVFASLAFLALVAGAVSAWPPRGQRGASIWARLAALGTVVSAVGYVVQTILDHVYAPPLVGQLEFYGIFIGAGFFALLTGVIAILTGRRRSDLTMSLGFLAVAYVLLAQLTQSLWD
jgi:drug/metabolite transporter (DMT)-like permease